MSEYTRIDGGVNAPKGFSCAGLRAGIKEGKTNKDMAMVYSAEPCVSAGVFTKNLVKAAPVVYDRERIEANSAIQAVVMNTGYANACTGEAGYADVLTEADLVAKELGLQDTQVLVMSTGVIGQPLPMDAISKGIPMLKEALSQETSAAYDAAEAIMTTDTKPKKRAYTFTVQGKTVTMGGMCKGSGMIHPNMGTMLGVITCDIAIARELLQKALSELVTDTFNMVSVDGDTSTNDTVTVLCNGMAGNTVIDSENEDYHTFYGVLREMMTELAKAIAADGEGATRLLTAHVYGADSKETAKILAKSIITSNLTKAAVFGMDANWGRILCAMGYSGADFLVDRVEIRLVSAKGEITLVTDGVALHFDEEKATEILSADAVTIDAGLHMGEEEAYAWGCDLTYEYVKINADYRS